jgi:hypothetical protein
VGRKVEADEVVDASLTTAEGLESPTLEFTIAAATAITAKEGIQLRAFRSGGDCILTGWLASRYRIRDALENT